MVTLLSNLNTKKYTMRFRRTKHTIILYCIGEKQGWIDDGFDMCFVQSMFLAYEIFFSESVHFIYEGNHHILCFGFVLELDMTLQLQFPSKE
jgi:hypothetical protein